MRKVSESLPSWSSWSPRQNAGAGFYSLWAPGWLMRQAGMKLAPHHAFRGVKSGFNLGFAGGALEQTQWSLAGFGYFPSTQAIQSGKFYS